MTVDVIKTERLILRPVTWFDAIFVANLLGDPEVRRYLGGPKPLLQRFRQARAYRKSLPRGGAWLVRGRNSSKRIGLVLLTPHHEGAEWELSFEFSPVFWGKGYAREAVAAVRDHAFYNLEHEAILAETQVANQRSRHLLQALGMQEARRVERSEAAQVIYKSTDG